MNKNKYIRKILSSCIVLSMVITAFGSLLSIEAPTVLAEEEPSGSEPLIRIYGEEEAVYPTHSYYGENDFIYPKEYDPFDPGIIEKDSITFNPAYIDGHAGEYEIKAQGDASEKIFLRAFYEPEYEHTIDAKMDAASDVTLMPVETFNGIITETTYHLVTLYDWEPTVGYPGETKMMLPYKANTSTDKIPGMEEGALLDVVSTYDGGTRKLTDGSVKVEKEYQFDNIDYSEDIVLSFMDHKVRIFNYENGDDQSLDKIDIDVSYIGNMHEKIASTDTHTVWEDSWGSGYEYYFDRENQKQAGTDPAHRWYLCIENADDDYLRIVLGRWLVAGETFYVDGVRYDMPAVYVANDGDYYGLGGGFKYITFQSPVPKMIHTGRTMMWKDNPLDYNVDDFSHVTSQYLASLDVCPKAMWLLPPFNEPHRMIDDIDVCYDCNYYNINGKLLPDEKPPLNFCYVDETIEPRFDSSLTERLDTRKDGSEVWEWYNVKTMPDRYTEFILPNQETTTESDGNEYLITSSYIAPNSEVDTYRDYNCKSIYEHEIYDRVSEIALYGERISYHGEPRFVYEYDAVNGLDFYVNDVNDDQGDDPSLRIYGESHFDYPTHSYTGQNDFIYQLENDPFDPGVIKKDSITFNPAFIDGHGGVYEIKAQGDASEKIFLRAFYEPDYYHIKDKLMDIWSDVTLLPVETFDAIVTETTYHLVHITDRSPTVGYPDETKIVLPCSSEDPVIPGMDEMALLDVTDTDHRKSRRLTDGMIAVEKEFEFTDDSYLGEKLRFMDHYVKVVNFEDADYYNWDKIDIQVAYTGNMNDAISSTDTHTIWEDTYQSGINFYFDRENEIQMTGTDPAHRWYLRVENADDDYLRITLGRYLAAGETFYVDGVRYDMPAVYVDIDGGFKYITFQSPIPKGEPIWELPLSKNVDDFSHVTSQYLASLPEYTNMWFLPPFNDEHWMIDDIDLEVDVCEVPLAGLLLDERKDSLDFYYIDETIEPRFDTSIAERLKTQENGNEYWQWYNVYTKPNQYTEFILEDQEIPGEPYMGIDFPGWYPTSITADGNEYLVTSSLIAPNSEVDRDRSNNCKKYDEHEIYTVGEISNTVVEDAQVCMIIDGSGSIDSSEWSIMRNGIANAIRYNLPHDGSVEFTVVQFGNTFAQVDVGPIVLTDANYESVASTVENIVQIGLTTPLAAGIDLATDTLEQTVGDYNRQLINIVTDGVPNVPDNESAAKAAAEASIDNMVSTLGLEAAEDEIDVEAVGITQENINWLRDNICWPQPGYDNWPPTGPGWIREVSNYIEFAGAIQEKFGLYFEVPIYPRVAFEYDADYGKGLFINENNDPNDPPVCDCKGEYGPYVEATTAILNGCDSYDPDGSIVNYEWIVDCITVYDGSDCSYDLSLIGYSEGIYSVELIVTDDDGATSNCTTTLTIGPSPDYPICDCNGPYIPGVEAQSVTLDGCDSYDPDGSIVNYEWIVNGTTVYTGPDCSYALSLFNYSRDVGYTVELVVTDNDGYTSSCETTLGSSPGSAVIEMANVDVPEEGTQTGLVTASGILEDVGSCQVTITWDQTVASVVNVDYSDFDTMYSYIDNDAGTLTVTASNSMITLSGSFTICRIMFEAVGSGGSTSPLTISYSELLTADPTPLDITHTKDNGLLTITGGGGDIPYIGDMNGNGGLDSGDVRYLALNLVGDPDYIPLYDNGDVNSDGNINSGDVRYLALHIANDPAYATLYP